MSRRKGEVTGHMNEREFPHLVELKLPPGGFRSQNLEFDAFHREHGIPIRRGRGRHEVEQFHVRFCFPDAPTADAFRSEVPFSLINNLQRAFLQGCYAPRFEGSRLASDSPSAVLNTTT